MPNGVPQSPRCAALITVCPRYSRIRTIASPTIVARKWPTCSSLATFGPEESTTTFCAGSAAARPRRGAASCSLAWAAIQSLCRVMLRNPGPLTSGGPATLVRSRWPASSVATSRGGRPSRLASGRATLAWKSANWGGRMSGWASAYSVPNAWASASFTRCARTSRGSAMLSSLSTGQTGGRHISGCPHIRCGRPRRGAAATGPGRVSQSSALRQEASGPAREVGTPARAEPLPDLLGDLAPGELGSEQARGRDRPGGRPAVRDDDGSLQAEQGRTAIALRVHPPGQLAKPAPLQQRAEPRRPGAFDDGTQLPGGEGGCTFEGLERDVAGEAVGDDHVHRAGQKVRAFDVAGEANRQGAVWRRGGEQLMGAAGQPVALPRLGADGEQAHPWLVRAVRDLRIGDAKLGELEQHFRLGVRYGPRVNEKSRIRAGGQHHDEGRPDQAGYRTQPQSCGRDDAAGGAGRNHRSRVASADQLASNGHARAWPPPAGQCPFVHRDGVIGGGDPDESRGQAGWQQRTQLAGRAGQNHRNPVIRGGRDRARNNLLGRVVAAHGIDRDDQPLCVSAGGDLVVHGRFRARGQGAAGWVWPGGAQTQRRVGGRMTRIAPSLSLHGQSRCGRRGAKGVAADTRRCGRPLMYWLQRPC